MTAAALPEGAKLHAGNTGFEWGNPAGPYRKISTEQARAWSEEGYFLLEDAFAPAELAELIADLDALDAKVTDFLKTQPGEKLMIAENGNITFMTHAVLQSAVAKAFCAHPVFQDLGYDLIGPDVRLYWDQGVYKKAEKPAEFPWHQDNGYTFVEPQQYLTCWVALNDATISNGCPWVVPGMHRLGTLAHWTAEAGFQCLEDPAGAVPVEAAAGSIVVFSSLTPHATGPNTAGGVRKAYIVQLAPADAKVVQLGPDGSKQGEVPANDPNRQYPILEAGERVRAPR
jgi:ectoine hydroxylase-related dioxygenase (phytanoyl-CoA dioxygenase family)